MSGPRWRRRRIVARTALRRTWRNLVGSTRGKLLLGGGGLLLVAYSLGIAAAALFGTSMLLESGADSVRLGATGVVAGLFALVLFVELQRTVSTLGEPDILDGLLTTIPYTDVLAGTLLAEWCRIVAAFALPILALVGGVAVGTGQWLVVPTLLGTLLAVLTVGLLVGYSGGVGIKTVAAQSAFVARHRAGISLVGSILLALIWVLPSAMPERQFELLRVVADSPLSWVADLALLGLGPAQADPAAAAVAGVVLLGVGGLMTVTTQRLTERVWYGDSVEPDHEFDSDDQTLADRVLAGRVSMPTRVVAQKSWLRAKRAPTTVQFATMPFFFLVYQLQLVILEGTVPTTLPLTAGLAAAAAFGAAFTLNPLGGEASVLPLTLTANVSGRSFINGLVLAGALPGVVVATALVVGLGVTAGTPPAALAVALVATLLSTVISPAIAVGAGVIFPKFEAQSVRGREIVVPSLWAFAIYFTILGVTAAPVVFGFQQAVDPLVPVPVTSSLLLAGGLGLSAVVAVPAGITGYLYAANRVATYRLE